MKKFLLAAGAALLSVGTNAQVGINAGENPKGTFQVGYTSDWATTKPQAVSFPNVSTAQRDAWNTDELEVGMMIFNTNKQCLEMYFGVKGGTPQWNCIPDTNSKQSQKIAVSPAGFEGQYIGGIAMNNGNKVKFKLQNNGFSAISNVDFSSAVTIQNGKGNVQVKPNQNSNVSLSGGEEKTLVYTLSGTPAAGKLTATFDRLGLQADQSVTVGLGSAKVSNKENYTVSLKYNSTQIQGLMNNTNHKVSIKIPYTNGKGSYNAVSNTQQSAAGQGGDKNPLTLKIPAGNFGVNGELTATISVGGDGEYKVKQMAPGQSYTIATFPINMNGAQYNVVLKGIGGIPDRLFGVQTNGKLEHQFVYIPITGPDGKTWLNNNLGADYANVNSPVFNPTKQATSPTDYHAYGSLFQWGRYPNGYELIKWTSSTAGSAVYNNLGWYSDSQLSSYHEPCPSGYHTPTKDEYIALHNAIVGKNLGTNSSSSDKMWKEKVLRLPAAGLRSYSGASFYDQSSRGWYWSSSTDGSLVWELDFNYSNSRMSNSNRAYGESVRCLKD